MRRPRQRGSSMAEALVAAALAGIALAGLSATAALATRSLRLARDASIALTLATERLETLRAGPRAAGEDVRTGPDGTVFTRTWSVAGGRGRPVELGTRVAWGPHALELSSEALP